MDYKTKRTVYSSSVLVASFIVCLVCVIVLVNALNVDTPSDVLPGSTNTPTKSPAISATTAPATTTPPATSNATPTQTYHNSPYTTAPQTTKTPEVTISVTTEPPATPTPDLVDQAELIDFSTKLIAFTENTATYELTMNFNATGTVRLIAIDSDRKLTQSDITPTFIRNTLSGANRNILSTPSSFTSCVATANTSVTASITVGHNPVDYFIIIDTDVENGLMSQSIVERNCGGSIPVITGNTAPVRDENGALTFDIMVSKDATVHVQFEQNSPGTWSEATVDGKVSFNIGYYDNTYAGISLVAYLEYEGATGPKVTLTGTIPAIETGENETQN